MRSTAHYDVMGFDVDGVLRRSRREIWRCVLAGLAHFGILRARRPTYGQFWCRYSEPFMVMWKNYGVTASIDEVVAAYTAAGGCDLRSPLYHDAPVVVRRIVARGTLVVAVSASPEENVRRCLLESGIEKLFAVIVGHAYEKANNLHDLRKRFVRNGARTFAYVGDIASDMEAARAAGWDGIAHAANHCAECALNGSPYTHRITRLRQLLSLSPPR